MFNKISFYCGIRSGFPKITLYLAKYVLIPFRQCQVINNQRRKNTCNDWWDLPDVWTTERTMYL
jgi:hypothetical protein